MFVPGKPFQPSLMFVGKDGGFVGKGKAKVLHSGRLVNYGRKKFYSTGPRCGNV